MNKILLPTILLGEAGSGAEEVRKGLEQRYSFCQFRFESVCLGE